MKSFAAVFVCLAIASASEQDSGCDASRWGTVTNGLRMRAVPVSAAMSEDDVQLDTPITTFASRDELAFAVEVENVSDHAIRLLDTRYGEGYGDSKGKANSNWLSQFLFSIEYFNSEQRKIERPEVQVVDLNMPISGALAMELGAGQKHRFLIRPSKWMRVMDQPLPPGAYSAVIHYYGLPRRAANRITEYGPTSEVLNAWSGDTTSVRTNFELEKPSSKSGQQHSVAWGEEFNGLRAAMRYSTDSPIHRHGEKPDLELQVQNVSDKPITIASPMWLSEIQMTARRAAGKPIDVASTMYSGWTLSVRVTLQPGQISFYNAGNLGLAETQEQAKEFPHVTHRTLVAPAGSYRVQLTANFAGSVLKDGKGNQLAPLEGDWQESLTTGRAPLVILEAAETNPANPDE